MSLYAKRLERGRFIWPSPADGTVAITAAQLAYMLDGIDWRNPVRAGDRRRRADTAAVYTHPAERRRRRIDVPVRQSLRDDAARPSPDEIDALKAALVTERTARQQAEARASGAEAMVAPLSKLLIAKMKRERFRPSAPNAAASCSTSWNCSSRSWKPAPRKTKLPPDRRCGAPPRCTALPARSRCEPRCRRTCRASAWSCRPACLPLLRRQAGQTRRGRHRDAGGGAAPVEGHPDRAREVHLPVMREDHPAAGAVPRHRPGAGRAPACWR